MENYPTNKLIWPHRLSVSIEKIIICIFNKFPGQRGHRATNRLQRPTSTRTEGSTPSGKNDLGFSLGAERPLVPSGGEVGVVPGQIGQGEFHPRRPQVAHTVIAGSNQIA